MKLLSMNMKYWALLFVAVGILMDIRKNRT